MAKLGVNIDHLATLRQARYRDPHPGSRPEPDPVALALVAEENGASGITVHLREDRRHIQDFDVLALRRKLSIPLNLEMSVQPALVDFALRLRPAEACLVPENRREVTTEGGLNILAQERKVQRGVAALKGKKIVVSLFIDPDPEQVQAAARVGAPTVELHTGSYALARTRPERLRELKRQARAAELGRGLGLTVNAGHGLNYDNVQPFLSAVDAIDTLNIGHSIVSRALQTGWAAAVKEMVELIR